MAHPRVQQPFYGHPPGPALGSAPAPPLPPPDATPFAENAAVLQSLFPSVDAEVVRCVLEAHGNSLARAIRMLSGEDVQPQQQQQQTTHKQQQPTVALMPGTAQPAQVHSGAPAPPPHSQHRLAPVHPQPPPASVPPSIHAVSPDGRLTRLQRSFFYDHGFLHLSGVVGDALVHAALGAINRGLGEGINVAHYHRPKGVTEGHFTYCPAAGSSEAVKDLFRRSALPTLVESLLGAGGFSNPGGAQIALTFPRTLDRGVTVQQAMEWWMQPKTLAKAWHIDGFHRKPGFAEERIVNFTTLVGVYLSSAPADFCGNIAVYPGSHHVLEQHFRAEDPLTRLVADESMPYAEVGARLSPPHTLHVRPGDVLLAHYQTAHTVTPNLSSSIRYAVYFRLTHSSRAQRPNGEGAYSPQCMRHIWTEYAGMQDLHAEAEQRKRDREQAGRAQAAAAQQRAAAGAQEEADLARALALSKLDTHARSR